MLKLNGIDKAFGGRVVLDGMSFTLGAGEHAGLIGPSGCGKTTLLRIIAGDERADAGTIERSPGLTTGYLRQGHHGAGRRTVREVFPAVFAAQAGEQELETLAQRMAEERDPARAEALAAAYAEALARLEHGESLDIDAAWRALDLRPVQPHEPVAALSGGEQTKLGLLELAAARPGALLLDEPTNNLDMAGLEWLGSFLDRFHGPVLIVSHDRAFLDEHADLILALDPATARIEAFPGGYSDYRAEQERRRAEQEAVYQRQQARERHILQEISQLKARAQRTERLTISGPSGDFYRARAAGVARRAKVMERRLRRELEGGGHIEKPVRQPHRVRAGIAEGQRAGDRMVAAERVALDIAGRPLLSDVDFQIGWGERVILLGRNGSGKTTLLRAILGQHPVAAGTLKVGPAVQIGYLPQGSPGSEVGSRKSASSENVLTASGPIMADSEALDGGNGAQPPPGFPTSDSRLSTPLEVIRATAPMMEGEARRFLHRFLFTTDQVHTPLARLSYGERRRLDLARLVVAGANLLILDEPTNHLDIGAREALEAALEEFSGAILAVTHDRYFIDRFAERVLMIERGRVREE